MSECGKPPGPAASSFMPVAEARPAQIDEILSVKR
jgi:hypothetical protein